MFGNLIKIDVDREKYKFLKVDDETIKNFIGGKGLGAYLLYTMLNKNTDPLSPNNLLMILTGPLTGTSYPTSGRIVVVTKSPLTGLYLDSQAGGFFGPELRRAGYDGIIIVGKSKDPIYIWINNGGIEFRDASKLIGHTISETVDGVRGETHKTAHVAAIGPAGEKIVKFASIHIDKDSDPWRGGIAARGGAGAVMGSKNLKAIAVKGLHRIKFYREKRFKETARNAYRFVLSNKFIYIRRSIGTSFWVQPMNRFGILPTRNFKQGFIEEPVGLYGEYMRSFVKRIVSCYNCPISCGKILNVEDGDVKVEYEDIALLGSDDGVNDVVEVAKATRLTNELGLDAISTGNTIAFAMECRERGLIDEKIEFGDPEEQRRLIMKIAYRKGIGDLLAEGVKRASEKIGGGSEKYAIHVKGLELPGYEPRVSWGMALAYSTSDRGGCHQRAWTTRLEIESGIERYSSEMVRYVKGVQDERAAAFSLVVCDFTPLYKPWLALQYATGIGFSEEDYLLTGERIWNITRLFNIREADISRIDDTLPYRMFEEAIPTPPDGGGNLRLLKSEFDKMLDEYYELRGWDMNGIPTKEKLDELSLDKIV